ncbi:DNA translocase FtsK [Paenibacillus sp. NEAU-GSW1]|nr:DNA translocase FtsK [Paenibacillus sp. NEAU-GSW1]
MNEKAISGGYIGAIQYSMLFMLFGYFGAKLVMWVMFAIAIMLMTGKSYVEMGSFVKTKLVRLFKLLSAKWSHRAALRSATAAAAAKSAKADDDNNQGYMQDDGIEDDDQIPIMPRRQKRSLFFSWRQQLEKAEDAHADNASKQASYDDWSLEDEDYASQQRNGKNPHWATEWEQEEWDRNGEQETVHNDGLKARMDNESDELDPYPAPEAAVPNPIETGAEDRWADETPWPQADADYHGNEESRYIAGHSDVEANSNHHAGHRDPYVHEQEEEEQVEQITAFDKQLTSGKNNPAPIASPPSEPVVPVQKPYMLPPFSLLAKPSLLARGVDGNDMDAKRKLEATLESFGVRAKVLNVVRGPAVTRYEVQPATGVKVSRIVNLTDDIALALAAKDIRMEAPIPGKSAIGIEVPNMEVSVVTMREVMETPEFQNAPSKLSISFGRDISGQPIIGNLARMPHLLVAGATGSGKSVCINGIITSILYKAKPDEVKFLMVDPKMVELNVYNGIPHLLAPVVTDPRRASLALKKIVVEMEKRYELFSKSSTRNIEGYNNLMIDNPKAVLPYIVVIVDELADLMMVAANDVEDSIARLAQMARAAGIHLIIATQRPSVDVITGVIKANIPSRIAFGVSSQVDSRTILDMVGAEKLLGRGDMLYLPVGMSKPIRVQGAFLSDQEVESLVEFSRGQAEAEYKEDLVPEVEEEDTSNPEEILDELYDQAVTIVIEAKQASVSLLQRRMRIGYTRAARLIDQMEARGIVGPYEGSKPREVLMTMDQFQAGRIPS